MIISIFTVIHLIAAVSIVILVLLQRGKGADMGAAFYKEVGYAAHRELHSFARRERVMFLLVFF